MGGDPMYIFEGKKAWIKRTKVIELDIFKEILSWFRLQFLERVRVVFHFKVIAIANVA